MPGTLLRDLSRSCLPVWKICSNQRSLKETLKKHFSRPRCVFCKNIFRKKRPWELGSCSFSLSCPRCYVTRSFTQATHETLVKWSDTLQWRHNERDGVSNHQPRDSLLYSGAGQRKHQSSASLVFVWGIPRWPVNSPHKRPVTRKMFPFDNVIMKKAEIINELRGFSWYWGVFSSSI